jgi:hypothetical protein
VRIEAPNEVVARLECWALIRHQKERLWSDTQPREPELTIQPYVAEDGVTVVLHDPVELEAYPVLDRALVRAICQWWKGAKYPSGSVLNGIPEGFSVNSGTVRALLRRPDLDAALGEGSWDVPAIAPNAPIPSRVAWTDKTGDVTLTFEAGELVSVQELGWKPPQAPLSLRTRPEQVVGIERDEIKADRIKIVLDGSHWDRSIWVPIPVAERVGRPPCQRKCQRNSARPP